MTLAVVMFSWLRNRSWRATVGGLNDVKTGLALRDAGATQVVDSLSEIRL